MMTKMTETERERLALVEARILANDLQTAERRGRLPQRVRKLWIQSIQRYLDRACGREPTGLRERATIPEEG